MLTRRSGANRKKLGIKGSKAGGRAKSSEKGKRTAAGKKRGGIKSIERRS